ncbi:MAG: quinolinate synthase NadA [Rickettsiaceae bacterium]|nr:quinolinate synthase NadA [Rickettsiaceae bacterium]
MKFQNILDLEREIARLKSDLNAVILSHYYQDSEIQDVSDFVGDSAALIKRSLSVDSEVIIFCGNRFVAESIAVLSPKKRVIIPDYNAGCSLAESCRITDFNRYKIDHPEYIFITHINSELEVKAISDFIVTSSDAEDVILSVPEDKMILFAPDKNFGCYLMNHIGREMKLLGGSCVVHNNFCERELVKIKTTNPKAKIIAHFMCNAVLLEYAEYVGSDDGLLDYISTVTGGEFIVLAEPGIIHQMHAKAPNNKFYDVPFMDSERRTCSSECHYMRRNNVENLHKALLGGGYEIKIPELIAPALQKVHSRFL